MRRIIRGLVLLAVIGAAVAWVLSSPKTVPAEEFAGVTGDATRGEAVFWAGGCASCHAAPGSGAEGKLILAGGQKFPSPFGTFIAPNISPDATAGIGGWSVPDFANAVMRGVSPNGAHYFPAFPYTSYNKATLQDVVDLKAFMDGLPGDATPSKPHDVGFPFNIRRSVGLWKLMFLNDDWQLMNAPSDKLERGRYLVEALGHCTECHTARNQLGGLERSAWLAGAPNPDGKGKVPNITPGALDWIESDIAAYLATGFTPEFDSAGGHMALVVESLAKLPEDDVAAIAAYLTVIPALP
jgi:mono/diheme cytochrome c family protein